MIKLVIVLFDFVQIFLADFAPLLELEDWYAPIPRYTIRQDIYLRALFWTISMVSDKYLGRPECHTGQAYSTTGHIMVTKTRTMSD